MDLTGPPVNFTYVNDNVPGPRVTIPNDPITGGCQCETTCYSNKNGCCPRLNEGTFAYSKNKKYNAQHVFIVEFFDELVCYNSTLIYIIG